MYRLSHLVVPAFVVASAASALHAAMLDMTRHSVVSVSTWGGSANPGSFSHSESTTSLDPWSAYIQSTAGASGSASQNSWLTDSVIYMSGHSAVGGGAGHGGGTTPSWMSVEFTLDDFHSYSYVGVASQAWFGYGIVRLTRVGGPVLVDSAFNVDQEWNGMLEPGRYELYTRLFSSSIAGFFYGNSTFTVTPIPAPCTLFAVLLPMACRRRR